MNFSAVFKRLLDDLRERGLYRSFKLLRHAPNSFPRSLYYASDSSSRWVDVWCSNDYLCLGRHPKVIEAMHKALDLYGAGAGGTRNIAGTSNLHAEFEESLAAFHNKEASLLFMSGYIANFTALSTLGRHLGSCIMYSDDENHNSIIEGVRGACSRKKIWNHNDVAHLRSLLKEDPDDVFKIVVCESLYSMSGDFAPLSEIVQVCQEFSAFLFVDEVHAVGLYGHRGSGVSDAQGVAGNVDIIQGTFGKSFGLSGGYLAGQHETIDFIRSFGGGAIFTTALPPVIVAGLQESLRIISSSEGDALRDLQRQHVKTLRRFLSEVGLKTCSVDSHIVPLLFRDEFLCRAVADKLFDEYNIYVQAIYYPTVPKGLSRVRVTVTPLHDERSIEYFVSSLQKVLKDLKHEGVLVESSAVCFS